MKFPEKTRRDTRNYFILLVFFVFVVVLLDLFVGGKLYHQFVTSLNESSENWQSKRFKDLEGNYPKQEKNKNTKRILYLSNSHALTGGKISIHLQTLLDLLFPSEYEIIDLSSGGMFTPEFLQRFSASLSYKIDYAILPLSYIAFSDRMGLSNQAASAHSMFHSDVIKSLPASFWFFNYDLGLFLNKLGERFVRLYRYRNELRNYWENRVSKWMKSIDNKYVIFIDSEKNTRWKFPKGYTNNLFQWNLYTLGRDKHLDNLQTLVSLSKANNIPLISANLPIHWEKEPGGKSVNDIRLFRQELADILEKDTIYSDYQDIFPVEFSSYDALHPTWYGARLHALDFALKINKLRNNPIDESEMYHTFINSDKALSKDYLNALNGNYPPLKTLSQNKKSDFFSFLKGVFSQK